MSLHAKPDDIHRADIPYLPHDKYKKKIYRYALILWMSAVGQRILRDKEMGIRAQFTTILSLKSIHRCTFSDFVNIDDDHIDHR